MLDVNHEKGLQSALEIILQSKTNKNTLAERWCSNHWLWSVQTSVDVYALHLFIIWWFNKLKCLFFTSFSISWNMTSWISLFLNQVISLCSCSDLTLYKDMNVICVYIVITSLIKNTRFDWLSFSLCPLHFLYHSFKS